MIKDTSTGKESPRKIEKSVILYEEKYFSVLRHEHLKSFELRYKEAAYDLFHFDEIKKITDKGITLLQQEFEEGYNYAILIINTIEGGPIIGKDAQNYTHTVFFPFLLKNQIMTHLLCLSEEVISKLSMTLIVESSPKTPFNIQYFSKYEDCTAYINRNL